jgi:hypothetical protein
LVVAEVRERLAVSKGVAQKTEMERFNVKELNEDSIGLQSETSLQLWKT